MSSVNIFLFFLNVSLFRSVGCCFFYEKIKHYVYVFCLCNCSIKHFTQTGSDSIEKAILAALCRQL